MLCSAEGPVGGRTLGRRSLPPGVSGDFVEVVETWNRKVFKSIVQEKVFQKELCENYVKLGKPEAVSKNHSGV